jgi:hypothetical protein
VKSQLTALALHELEVLGLVVVALLGVQLWFDVHGVVEGHPGVQTAVEEPSILWQTSPGAQPESLVQPAEPQIPLSRLHLVPAVVHPVVAVQAVMHTPEVALENRQTDPVGHPALGAVFDA